ncbi:hypothetical protein [Virgibacillus sp. DJP39]|uniref:hypothetical protein n=1 Tax=Virgibacillus sp. DJP39 TaxID=3409790 RepID=UPI003BB683A1
MYLFVSIVLSAILGLILFMMGPMVGGILAFGIVVGSIFRGLYLLGDIHKRTSDSLPVKDKIQEAYDAHLNERDEGSY